ncbi:phage terminase large subunit family protein [Halorientalis litorea]|uniref:phage terminase large subunit family protein n=1 Tax=Halorientalis litorea TaxID=2931977 RepID=UPI001FF612EB|nr:phage terminase large subunit family protein [Halorientalis litorea]
MAPPSEPTADQRPKAVLFCPDCGHESHVTGDWEVRTSAGRETYVCPVCDAVLTTRHSERLAAD